MVRTKKSSFSSVNEIMTKMVRINHHSLSILKGLTDSLISTDEFININLKDENNNSILYRIPSYSFLKSKIYSLDQNLELLRNNKIIEDKNLDINKDKLFYQPNIVKNLVINDTIEPVSNNFIKNLIDPYFKLRIDLKTKVDQFSKEVSVKELIIDEINTERIPDWEQIFQGKNDLEYITTKEKLMNLGISFYEQTTIQKFRPLKLRYSGQFRILNINPDEVIQSAQLNVRKYLFDTINYIDNLDSGLKSIKQLQKNDVIRRELDTYRIVSTTEINNQYFVELELLQGYDIIKPLDVFYISSEAIESKEIEINVNYDQRKIIFVNDIMSNTNVISSMGLGVAIDSNYLTVNTEKGPIKFHDYYSEYVYEYFSFFDGLKSELKIPAKFGIKPNKPILNPENFKVVRINNQRKNNTNPALTAILGTIESHEQQKNVLTVPLEEKRITLHKLTLTDDYDPSDPIVLGLNNEISLLQNQIMNLQQEINSLKNQTVSLKIQETDLEVIQPKYHTRGFWDIPEAKKDKKNRYQNIIQFKIQYRYLDLLENPNCNVKIDFSDLSGDVKDAIFSEWVEVLTPVRQKRWDEELGIYVWDADNIQSSTPNFNQLSIPINKYEKVEFRIKSISEAGWPDNPLESDWSDTIIVSFPDGAVDDDVETILNIQKYKEIQNDNNIYQALNLLTDEVKRLKAELDRKLYSTQETLHIRFDTEIYSTKTIKLKVSPDPRTLMIFNLEQGKILNPTVDFTLNENIITLENSYVEGLEINDKFLIIFKDINFS